MCCPQSDDRLYKNTNSVVPCRRCGLAMGRRLGAAARQSRHSPSVAASPCDFLWGERESPQRRCDRSGSRFRGLAAASAPPCGTIRHFAFIS